MNDLFTPQDWLRRAKSNLIVGSNHNIDENLLKEVFFEDLCFELQQCVEKSIKALLIFNGIEFSKTHDINVLIDLLKSKTTILLPDEIERTAKRLTQYAAKTRTPIGIKFLKKNISR